MQVAKSREGSRQAHYELLQPQRPHGRYGGAGKTCILEMGSPKRRRDQRAQAPVFLKR
jgi:hypothetical protein